MKKYILVIFVLVSFTGCTQYIVENHYTIHIDDSPKVMVEVLVEALSEDTTNTDMKPVNDIAPQVTIPVVPGAGFGL